ncbi:hypothetical protein M514_07417 [Trichuris suis]|uniref:Uncharacterized protein n=1 Tax=Trichuris suis TaxID=68888 RepID=A0A085NCA7_9BILA|nr:hypothetical protein M513_07417 [Trichuris suis]KFD67103.1 hypothetical protein M514_07417 [Trichuris suis]
MTTMESSMNRLLASIACASPFWVARMAGKSEQPLDQRSNLENEAKFSHCSSSPTSASKQQQSRQVWLDNFTSMFILRDVFSLLKLFGSKRPFERRLGDRLSCALYSPLLHANSSTRRPLFEHTVRLLSVAVVQGDAMIYLQGDSALEAKVSKEARKVSPTSTKRELSIFENRCACSFVDSNLLPPVAY